MSTPIVAGIVASAVYFLMEEQNIKRPKNGVLPCRYLAPLSVDVFAWIFGAVLIKEGVKFKSNVITFIGTCVICIHTIHFMVYKIFKSHSSNLSSSM